jgi:hypothetical protein
MPIDQKVKDAVTAMVLQDLQAYFEEAAEAEDDVTLLDPDPAKRLRDFYQYKIPD